MKKTFKSAILRYGVAILLLAVVVHSHVLATFAASLKFDPPNATVDKDGTFSVKVEIDSGTNEISGTDAYILYDASVVQPQSVQEGNHFPTVTNTISADKISISGVITDPTDFRTGKGTLATITFKALKTGTGDLRFYCELSANDTSKIVKSDINATNIIQCNSLSSFTLTVASSEPTATPVPPSPMPTSGHVEYKQPDKLPDAGIFDNVMVYTISGAVLLVVGGIVRFMVLK